MILYKNYLFKQGFQKSESLRNGFFIEKLYKLYKNYIKFKVIYVCFYINIIYYDMICKVVVVGYFYLFKQNLYKI